MQVLFRVRPQAEWTEPALYGVFRDAGALRQLHKFQCLASVEGWKTASIVPSSSKENTPAICLISSDCRGSKFSLS